jgi:hypothetical protein
LRDVSATLDLQTYKQYSPTTLRYSQKNPMTFMPPNIYEKSFTCPHCGVLARQKKWGYYLTQPVANAFPESEAGNELGVSLCDNCSANCLWVHGVYVYPVSSSAPRANPDMPANIKADYDEAAAIYAQSPRGAAALLRLAVQKLMVHLGQPGKNINDDIAALVADGLPTRIQQALDVVRITGNNAVHPGQLDADDVSLAYQLFPLVNFIVEYQISMPSQLDALYNGMPPGALSGIAKRDGPK